jgi:hypothetical protein
MRLNARTLVTLAAVLSLMSACAGQPEVTSEASASPVLTGTPNPSGPAPCEPLDLRTPSGDRIDLTGTWRGAQTLVYVRQEANCVWWMALSDYPDEALGSRNMLLYRGNLYPDFTLRGDWMHLMKPSEFPQSGSTTFEIDTDIGGIETIVLRSTEPDFASLADARPYGGVTLTYVGPLPSDGLP